MDKPNLDKLDKQTGQNQGRVLNSRLERACICHVIAHLTKWTRLKLKTWSKQIVGYLPLAFE